MQKGFTLIELLVVIGIIGVLSSAVLLRYPVTIDRVKDARIASEMGQFREQAGVLFSLTGEFAEITTCVLAPICSCVDDTSLDILCKDIQENTDEALVLRVNDNEEKFCFIAHLPGEKTYFCIDSELRAKQYLVSPANNVCDVACEVGNSCACE